MAISVYDWGSVLEQLQTGNQELKPNLYKAMKMKSQITPQELKRETRWWYRRRRQRGSGGCVCMRVFVIKICVAVSVLVIGKGELCFWSSSLKCTVPLLPFVLYCYTTVLLLPPLWVSLLLSYCLCPDLRIWVYLSLEKGETCPNSSVLLLLLQ